MKINQLKSELPLCGKGLLMFQRPEFFTPENRIGEQESENYFEEGSEVEEKVVRKIWSPPHCMDQGKLSVGVGAAAATFLECDGIVQNLEMTPLDFAKSLYYESQRKDPVPGTEQTGYFGTCLVTAMQTLEEKRFFRKLLWTDNTSDLAKHILKTGPAIVAGPWFSEMSKLDPNGFARPNGIWEGNHCWVVYGVDDLWETFFAINSWGREYGKDGKFLVKFSDMDKILSYGYALSTR
jgi:hypothetical protein